MGQLVRGEADVKETSQRRGKEVVVQVEGIDFTNRLVTLRAHCSKVPEFNLTFPITREELSMLGLLPSVAGPDGEELEGEEEPVLQIVGKGMIWGEIEYDGDEGPRQDKGEDFQITLGIHGPSGITLRVDCEAVLAFWMHIPIRLDQLGFLLSVLTPEGDLVANGLNPEDAETVEFLEQ